MDYNSLLYFCILVYNFPYMILFISGRTDIPAFYSDWFMNRLKAGFVDVRNPYYGEQVTRYSLDPKVVDALVFCTKNPRPMLEHIEEIKSRGFNIYFFVTITPYSKDIEPSVPDKSRIINSFIELSRLIGKENISWRYDPVFINDIYSIEFHKEAFFNMAEKLSGHTNRCIISFIDLYKKTVKNFPYVREVKISEQEELACKFSESANKFGITIESCAEKYNLSEFGVKPGACVSRKIIENTCSFYLKEKLPPNNLRENCACLPMHDIGAYNSCPHLCRYCYANYDESLVRKNLSLHNPESSFLIGVPKDEDIVKKSRQESFKDEQGRLL